MFNFRSKKSQPKPATDVATPETNPPVKEKRGLVKRFGDALKRTRQRLSSGFENLFLGKKTIDDALFEQLETVLLTADMGVETTEYLLKRLTEHVSRSQLSDPAALLSKLKVELLAILKPVEQPLTIEPPLFTILVLGANGVGKTTTIAKLAHHYQSQGKKVMLAAGDTFRAAAVEQLQRWGTRLNIPVIAQHTGADSAAVIYDAMQAASARHYDVLIADTAGRLHTQSHLMRELQKVKRIIQKINPDAPQEVMLVLDAGTGQNALQQARQFHESMQVSGLTLTKLDGTAKGGSVFAIAKQIGLPIRFIGLGEHMDDLQTFHAQAFIDALFETSSDD